MWYLNPPASDMSCENVSRKLERLQDIGLQERPRKAQNGFIILLVRMFWHGPQPFYEQLLQQCWFIMLTWCFVKGLYIKTYRGVHVVCCTKFLLHTAAVVLWRQSAWRYSKIPTITARGLWRVTGLRAEMICDALKESQPNPTVFWCHQTMQAVGIISGAEWIH